MIITPLVASIFGVMYVILAMNIVKLRHKFQVSVGHGDNEELHRSIRAHANLIEYAPLLLILLATLEFNNAPTWICALAALPFVAGRLLHAWAMAQPHAKGVKLRVLGMQLTLWTMLALCALNVLWLFIGR